MSRARRLVAHLIRMHAMKERRLTEWDGTPEGASYLRADVAALAFAISELDYYLHATPDGGTWLRLSENELSVILQSLREYAETEEGPKLAARLDERIENGGDI